MVENADKGEQRQQLRAGTITGIRDDAALVRLRSVVHRARIALCRLGGRGGLATGGAGPAIGVGASGNFWSVHAAATRVIGTIQRDTHTFFMRASSYPDLPRSPVLVTLVDA